MRLTTMFSAAAVTFLSTYASQAHDGLPACTPELKASYWLNSGLANIPGPTGAEARKRMYEIASMCDIYGQ